MLVRHCRRQIPLDFHSCGAGLPYFLAGFPGPQAMRCCAFLFLSFFHRHMGTVAFPQGCFSERITCGNATVPICTSGPISLELVPTTASASPRFLAYLADHTALTNPTAVPGSPGTWQRQLRRAGVGLGGPVQRSPSRLIREAEWSRWRPCIACVYAAPV